jgi:hypothetical protein
MSPRAFRPRLTAPLLDGWVATKESLTLLAPSGKANVIASREPLAPGMDTAEYAEAQSDHLRTELPEYRQLSFEETEVFGGRPGLIRRFEWNPPEGNRVTQIQLYYAESGAGYTATATTESADFDGYESDLRAVLEGLTVADDESGPHR